jgi:phosphoribosylanthranilate isomerase
MTRIKICGITNVEDALAAVEFGADAIGMIFALSPRQVDIETAMRICGALPPFVLRVGVFVQEAATVLQTAVLCGLDAIQLHGDQSEEFARTTMGHRRIIRAVRMKGKQSLIPLKDYRAADAYLLDTYCNNTVGGTGRVFNWDLAVVAKDFGKPVIVAGGLTPSNVGLAIQTARPYAIDVSSGVESEPGKKDHVKLKELIDNVRSTDRDA